jgi:glutathione S-transferase
VCSNILVSCDILSVGQVNYYGRELPLTKEFLKLHNSVPAGYDAQGNPLRESMPIVYWVDEHWPAKNPLQPSSAEGVARMKELITKFTSGEFDVTSSSFRVLTERDSAKAEAQWEALQRAYAELGRTVSASGGPYLLGEQFTVADLAVYPFVEKATILLSHFKSFATPLSDELAPFHKWVAAVESRPSVRITIADRLPRSVAVQPFGALRRAEYIVESCEGMAHGVKDIFRKQLLHAPPGVASSNLVEAIRQRDADNKAKAAAEAKV